MVEKIPFKKFYEATGRANAGWQTVEDGVCDIFTRTVICSISGSLSNALHPRADWMVSGIFYSSTNIRARLTMITSILKTTVEDDEINAEWKKVKNKVLHLYKRRNIIAHGHVWGNNEGASAVHASIFNENMKGKLMDYEQVVAAEQAFEKLAKRCGELAISVNKYFSELKKRK